MTDLGLLHYYFGMQVYQYKDYTYLSPSKYISYILQKLRMAECKFAMIPVSLRITVSLSSNSHLVDATTYRQLNDSLLYLTIFKPDISFVVNLMTLFMQKIYVEYLNAIKKILRYVVGKRILLSSIPSLFSLGS